MYFEKLDILKWFPIIQIVYSLQENGLYATSFSFKAIYRICNKCIMNYDDCSAWDTPLNLQDFAYQNRFLTMKLPSP